MLEELPPVTEPVCYDHFETFGVSQYFPVGVGTAIARSSRLMLGFDVAPHRRRGRMSDEQKRQRAQLERANGRPDPRAYVRAMHRTLDRLTGKLSDGDALLLQTDDMRDYQRAVRSHSRAERIQHEVYRNPPRGPRGAERSPEARKRDLVMRTIDFAHQFIRHSQAHHRRETIAFARRHNALLERLFLHGAWVNLIKLRVENDPRSGSRAMAAGLTRGRWDWERLLARRLQPRHVALPEDWRILYFRETAFPPCAERKRHENKLAV
jgi:hypothetical protein